MFSNRRRNLRVGEIRTTDLADTEPTKGSVDVDDLLVVCLAVNQRGRLKSTPSAFYRQHQTEFVQGSHFGCRTDLKRSAVTDPRGTFSQSRQHQKNPRFGWHCQRINPFAGIPDKGAENHHHDGGSNQCGQIRINPLNAYLGEYGCRSDKNC